MLTMPSTDDSKLITDWWLRLTNQQKQNISLTLKDILKRYIKNSLIMKSVVYLCDGLNNLI